jgi:hypothetical protein
VDPGQSLPQENTS